MMYADRLWTRNFLGLFLSQFFGAFNDNLFKVALITLWALSAETLPLRPEVLAMVANGLFILPFVLFAKLGGMLADNTNRARLVQRIKLLECGIMALAMMLFLMGQGTVATFAMLSVLFLMGVQSTLFGPVKYAILPQMVRGGGLMRANALVEGSTFLAILFGILIGALMIEQGWIRVLSGTLLVVAGCGFLSALLISVPQMAVLRSGKTEHQVPFFQHFCDFFSESSRAGLIIAISWFWAIGAILVAQLPIIARGVSEYPGMITFFLAILLIGIALGNGIIAYLSTKYSVKNLLSLSVVAYLAMGLLLWNFAFLLAPLGMMNAVDITSFVSSGLGMHFVAVLLGLAVSAGIFSVPLYTALLNVSVENVRGRNIALNNFCNAVLIVLSSVLAIGLLFFLSLSGVFVVFAMLHLLGIPAVMLARGDSLSRMVLRVIFRVLYRVKLRGLEHYPVHADGLIIACNHLSYLDAPLLLGFLPRKPAFVIDKETIKLWWIRIWLGACKVYPVDSQSPFAMKTVIKILQSGEHVVVFPEGAISSTGRVGKIYAGMGVIANHTGKAILGVRVSGLELTCFGRMQGSPKRLFARVSLDITPARVIDVPPTLTGKMKRKFILDESALMMREVVFHTSPYLQHIYQQLLNTVRDYGLGRVVVEDLQAPPMKYRKLLIGSQVLAQQFARLAPFGGGVGVLLPNSQAVIASFFALQAIDRIAVMLNFTAGSANLIAATQVSTIQAVITSRRFVELAKLDETIDALSAHVEIVYLEDVYTQISVLNKLAAFAKVQFGLIARPRVGSDSTAVILFTSGSEGVPKGVALSHRNILANVYQALAVADFSAADRLFNPLPVFHCFGLTAGALLPILSGGRCFQFPTPLRYRQIVELIYQWKATVLFGANSFLSRYGEVASPQDLQSLRYVFAGAEKLQGETYQAWLNKFGIQILQGYGVTEASPILAVNTRAFHKVGTVGLPLPGIECRIEPLPDLPDPDSGVLHVRGPNVMQGYILADNPGAIRSLKDGWHNTGDIVRIDEEFFVSILGRQCRFAKIAGEMVSLEMIENLISHLWPEHQHAVLYREHKRRGEEIVLFTENLHAGRDEILTMLHTEGKSLLIMPSQIVVIAEIPLLSTGKVDYVRLAEMM